MHVQNSLGSGTGIIEINMLSLIFFYFTLKKTLAGFYDATNGKSGGVSYIRAPANSKQLSFEV